MAWFWGLNFTSSQLFFCPDPQALYNDFIRGLFSFGIKEH